SQYGAASREVDQLKKMNDDLMAKKAGVDEKKTQLETEIASIEGELSKIESQKAEKNAEVGTATSSIEADVKTLTDKRNTFLGDLPKPLLAIYNRLRRGRKGVGVAAAVNGLCTGCNLNLPPQMYNQLFLAVEEWSQCPSCQRLLYLPP